jgi:hypothetical protein
MTTKKTYKVSPFFMSKSIAKSEWETLEEHNETIMKLANSLFLATRPGSIVSIKKVNRHNGKDAVLIEYPLTTLEKMGDEWEYYTGTRHQAMQSWSNRGYETPKTGKYKVIKSEDEEWVRAGGDEGAYYCDGMTLTLEEVAEEF